MAIITDEAGAALLDEGGADILDEAGAVVPAAQQGSWYGLLSVLRHNEQEFESYVSRPPMACPNDGEPLINAPATMAGSGCQLYCRYDGWQYPRDWQPPSRPAPSRSGVTP